MRYRSLGTPSGPGLVYRLAVEVLALAVTGWVLLHTPPPSTPQVWAFAAIAAVAVAVVVGTAWSTRLHRQPQRNHWTVHVCYLVAGVFVVPVNLLVLLLMVPVLHDLLRNRPRPQWGLTTAATALAVFAARMVAGWTQPDTSLPTFVLATVVLVFLRVALVVIGILLTTRTDPRNPFPVRSEDLDRPGVAVPLVVRAGGASAVSREASRELVRTTVESLVGSRLDVGLGVVAVSLGGLLALAVSADPRYALLLLGPMVMLERAAQLPHWMRSAQQDAKTGLANAVHWERTARAELERARTRGAPVALLLADLDHFKQINDRVGHLAGDAALAAVARTLHRNVRRGDLVGRFGGEEFVVLLPDTDMATATGVAERIRRTVADLRVGTTTAQGRPHLLFGLTISIGVADTDRFGYELVDLLGAADAALLTAKGAGRNLVSCAPPPEPVHSGVLPDGA